MNDLVRFYGALDRLAWASGGPRRLSECHGRLSWPERGVYFFFEPGEVRTGSGHGPRVVRVGTHALKEGSRASLWSRLSIHRGSAGGNGSHRASVFRQLVGEAWIRRRAREVPSWGVGMSPGAAVAKTGLRREAIRSAERPVEEAVSEHVGAMSLLWLEVPDAPGPGSLRGVIERGAIALLSSAGRRADPPSGQWLGRASSREAVRASGLWNVHHVEEARDSGFLDRLEAAIERVR